MKSSVPVRITQHAAKKRKPPVAPVVQPSLRLITATLFVILLVGLAFGLSGLSHGLAHDEVYHPDTPRLIWASRQFLEGTYFFRINRRDYDGYPYFYSHVVEYLWRGIRAVNSFFSHVVLGTDRTGEPLHHEHLTTILFWLARLTNVVFCTLTILVVYRIGARTLDRTTGLIGAGLLAVSPMNIATAHFATNDTMLCFFTTLTVLFAIRVCTGGLWLDYLLGGVLVACSFSAKYHGGIVGLTFILAHIMRYWPPRKAFTKEALSRFGLMAIAFLITFLLANPCFLVSPGKAFHDFREYCQYIPTAKLSPSEMEMGFFAKASLSFGRNFPILVRSVGAVVCVVGFAGLVRAFFRGKTFAVLASFPALYFLLTFLSKPIQQRFYLAALFPTMFLLAAALLVELARIIKVRTVPTIAALVVLSPAGFYLVKSSLREAFFFSHRDTRRCSKEWASENIPSSYKVESGDYTFSLKRTPSQRDFQGTIFVSSSIRPAHTAGKGFLLKVFDLEKDALPLFRNPMIEIRAEPSDLLSGGFTLPVYQRIPSPTPGDFIFADGATFYQDEKMMRLGLGRPVSRFLVSSQPIDSAIVIVKNGSTPGNVRVRFGGVTQQFFLDPCEVRWKELRGMRQSFPSDHVRHFYRLRASTTVSDALLQVSLTSEEKGAALYNIGEYAAAYPFLVSGARKNKSPALAAMAYICGKLCMSAMSPEDEKFLLQKASALNGDVTPETINSLFGISPDYLSALGYVSLKPEERFAKGFHSVEDASASGDLASTLDREPPPDGTWRVSTPPLLLEPGCYVAAIRARCEPSAEPEGSIKVSLLERRAKIAISEREFPVSSLANSYAYLEFPFEKPGETVECWVSISSSRYVPLFVGRIDIKPDPVKSLLALQRLLKIVTADPDSRLDVGPLDYNALLLLGRQRLAQSKHHQSLQYYLLAHMLRSDLVEPIRGIRTASAQLSPQEQKEVEEILGKVASQQAEVKTQEVSVAFSDGMRLTGFSVNRGPFRPGERFAMSLNWSVPRARKLPKGLIVWVHLRDQRGKRAFQLDHYLYEDVSYPQKPERIVPLLTHEARIPDDTLPGKYRIEIGLWDALRDWRPRVTSTSLPHTGRSATIGEIVIEPR